MPLNLTVGGDGRALFWIFWLVRWRRGRLGHDGHQQRAEALEHVLTDARELIRSRDDARATAAAAGACYLEVLLR